MRIADCLCAVNFGHVMPDSPAGILGHSRRADGGNMEAFPEQQSARRQRSSFVSNYQWDDWALHCNPQQLSQLLNPGP